MRKQIFTCHSMGVIEGVGSEVFSGSTRSADEVLLHCESDFTVVALSLRNNTVYLNRSRHNIQN